MFVNSPLSSLPLFSLLGLLPTMSICLFGALLPSATHDNEVQLLLQYVCIVYRCYHHLSEIALPADLTLRRGQINQVRAYYRHEWCNASLFSRATLNNRKKRAWWHQCVSGFTVPKEQIERLKIVFRSSPTTLDYGRLFYSSFQKIWYENGAIWCGLDMVWYRIWVHTLWHNHPLPLRRERESYGTSNPVSSFDVPVRRSSFLFGSVSTAGTGKS